MKEWPLDKPFLLMLLMSKTTKTCAYFAPSLVLHSLALLWLPFIAEKRPMAHKRSSPRPVFLKFVQVLNQLIGVGTQDTAFPTSSQMLLLLLVYRPYFEWQGKTIWGAKQRSYLSLSEGPQRREKESTTLAIKTNTKIDENSSGKKQWCAL